MSAEPTTDPVTSIFSWGARKAFRNDEESDADRIKRLEQEIKTGRSRAVIGKGVDPSKRVTYTEPVLAAKRDELADLYEKYGVALGNYGLTLESLRPAPVAQPIPGPTVTAPTPSPIVTAPTPPRIVTGDVLTEAERIKYDMAREQVRAVRNLERFGGRGSVGAALALGAALWAEFGAEILVENAARAAKADAEARAKAARKGPLTRRYKTAKRGKIRRETAPAVPKVPSDSWPQAAEPAQKAAERVQRDQKAAERVQQAAERVQTTKKPTKARQLTRSELLGVVAAVLSSGKVRFKSLLTQAESVLSATAPATQTQSQTSLGGGGNILTTNRTTEGKRNCYQVCRTKNRQRKKKKRSRKVCIDKGSLTKLVKSITTGVEK